MGIKTTKQLNEEIERQKYHEEMVRKRPPLAQRIKYGCAYCTCTNGCECEQAMEVLK